MRRAFLLSLAAVAVFLAVPAWAQEYGPPSGEAGPPANIPTGPDMSSIPTGMGPPADIPTGMGPPAGIQMGPSPEQMAKIEQQKLSGMKKGAAGMEKPVKNFETMFAKAEQKGVVIPQDLRDKLTALRAMVETLRNAQTADEAESVDMDQFNAQLEEISDAWGKLAEQAGKMQAVKKALKGMEQGVNTFAKQLDKFGKKGVVVPADLTELVATIKSKIEAVKNAATLDEANLDELPDLMEKLSDAGPRLEILARWPQTLKQMDKTIAALNRDLASAKKIVAKLSAKGLDLSENYAALETAANEFKTVRDNAKAKIEAGDSEGVFDTLETDFFDKIDNVYENYRVIRSLSELQRFAAEYKKALASAQSVIRKLKKAGKAEEVQPLYDEAKAKGDAVVGLIKIKPIDEEAVMNAVEEFETARQALDDKTEELLNAPMPWEGGKKEFAAPTVPKDLRKFMTQ